MQKVNFAYVLRYIYLYVEKDLKSVNTKSNLYICILILNELASSQEVSNSTLKL